MENTFNKLQKGLIVFEPKLLIIFPLFLLIGLKSQIFAQTLTSATYDYNMNVLVVTCTDLVANPGAANDVDVSKLIFTGEGGGTYTLTSATDVEITSSTEFSVTIIGADLTNVEAILNKDGTSSTGGTTYNLAAAENWLTGADPADDIADLTGNGITVSNYANPTITSATYDVSNGQLVVTGTNLVSKSGATNDIDASTLTFRGEGGNSYQLTSTPDVELTSATSFTLTLSATDQLNVHGLLNKNGLQSADATVYNLGGADNWVSGSPAVNDIADVAGNAVSVSNVQTPTIVSATYDSDTGIMVVTGTNLFKKFGAANDIDMQKFTVTGEGSDYTILAAITDVEITSKTEFSVTLTGADKTQVDSRLDLIGTQSSGGTTYNIAAAEDWLTAADPAANIADLTGNGITVVIKPRINSAIYNAAVGVLVVTGSNIQANGGGADIDASKFTFTGEGGETYTLTNTADVERTSSTEFTLTLSTTDRAAVNPILNKNGTASTNGTTYNLAAADDWCTNETAGNTEDLTGNGITVSNVPAPAITSIIYNALTGALVVTGTGMLKNVGTQNDIDASRFTLTGEGGETYTLTNTPDTEIISGTAFTLNLSVEDRAAVNPIMNKNGSASTSGTTYNLAAAEDWAAGADPAVIVADVTGNGITVSGVAVPVITTSDYHWSAGILTATGTGFLKKSGAANDIDASKFTFKGEGGATYTLIGSSDVDIKSGTEFSITLDATDKAAVNVLLNKPGTKSEDNTTYNLAAAEDWARGADPALVTVDATTPVMAGNFPPTGGDDLVATNEDQNHTFTNGDFTFNDIDSDNFAGIKIESLETNGDLEYDGTDVAVDTDCPDVTLLVFKPAHNAYGTPYATFTFKVKDDGGAYSVAAYTMTINVTPVNDPPTISNIPNQTTIEDQSTSWIPFTVNDAETNPAQLKLHGTSDNQTLVANNNIKFSGTGSSRRVKVTPMPNQTGTVQISVFVSDGTAKRRERFKVTISGVNDAPVITNLPDVNFDEDSTAEIDLDDFIYDADHQPAQLNWSAEVLNENDSLWSLQAENTASVSALTIIIDDTSHIALFSALPNHYGTHQAVFTVTDPDTAMDSDTLTVVINPVNDPPRFTADLAPVTLEQGKYYSMPLALLDSLVEDPDNPDSTLIWTIEDNMHFEPEITDHMITLHAPTNWFGTDTLIVIVSDGELSDLKPLQVTVTALADEIPPERPRNLTATPHEMHIHLNWSENTEPDIKSYFIYRTTDSTNVTEAHRIVMVEHPLHAYNDSTAEGDIIYFYGVTAVDTNGNESGFSRFVEAVLRTQSSVQRTGKGPAVFSLSQNYPNPFNPITTIEFGVPIKTHVNITVFDMLGREICELVNEIKQPGVYVLKWNAVHMESGLYFFRIRTSEFHMMKKCMVIK